MADKKEVYQGAQCQERADQVTVMVLELFNELELTVEEAAESAIGILLEIAGQTGVKGTAKDNIVSVTIEQLNPDEE